MACLTASRHCLNDRLGIHWRSQSHCLRAFHVANPAGVLVILVGVVAAVRADVRFVRVGAVVARALEGCAVALREGRAGAVVRAGAEERRDDVVVTDGADVAVTGRVVRALGVVDREAGVVNEVKPRPGGVGRGVANSLPGSAAAPRRTGVWW